jgi:prophage regulatory protein
MSSKPNSQITNPIRRVLRMAQLRQKIPFSESHLYALISQGRFPKPFQIFGGRASFWYEDDIDEWLSAQKCSSEEGQ